MNIDSQTELRERLAELKNIEGINWKEIREWISVVRPLLREHYSNHLSEFDKVAKLKKGVQASFGGDAPQVSDAAEKAAAVESYRALVKFVEGLADLKAPGEPKSHEAKFNAAIQKIRDAHSALRSLEDEAGSEGNGEVADSARKVHVALESALKLVG